MPRVAAVVAVITQVLGVGRGLALILEQRAVGIDAVVTQIRVEANLIERLGLGTVGVYLQALQGLKVRRGVGLAHQGGADAVGAQVVTDCQFFERQRHCIPRHLMAADIAPGVGRHARRAADGALCIGPTETHAGGGQAVDIRRMQMGMAVAGQVVSAQLVAHDVEHVAHGFGVRHRNLPNGGQVGFFAVRGALWQVHLGTGFYALSAWVWLLTSSQASQLPQLKCIPLWELACLR